LSRQIAGIIPLSRIKSDGHRPQQGGAGYPMPIFDPADAPDPEQVYANYLRSCVMAGIEPVPRDEDAV